MALLREFYTMRYIDDAKRVVILLYVALSHKKGDDTYTDAAANEASALRVRSLMALVSQNEQ